MKRVERKARFGVVEKVNESLWEKVRGGEDKGKAMNEWKLVGR